MTMKAGGPVKALDYRLRDLKLCHVHRAFCDERVFV